MILKVVPTFKFIPLSGVYNVEVETRHILMKQAIAKGKNEGEMPTSTNIEKWR